MHLVHEMQVTTTAIGYHTMMPKMFLGYLFKFHCVRMKRTETTRTIISLLISLLFTFSSTSSVFLRGAGFFLRGAGFFFFLDAGCLANFSFSISFFFWASAFATARLLPDSVNFNANIWLRASKFAVGTVAAVSFGQFYVQSFDGLHIAWRSRVVELDKTVSDMLVQTVV